MRPTPVVVLVAVVVPFVATGCGGATRRPDHPTAVGTSGRTGSVAQAEPPPATSTHSSTPGGSTEPTSPTANPAPRAPAAGSPSSSCLLDAFLAVVGPDRVLSCDSLISLDQVDRSSCSVTATQYLGPAEGNESIILSFGAASPPARPRGEEGQPEVIAVTRRGEAFRMYDTECQPLTQAEYDSMIEEREQIDTSGEE